MKTEDLTVLNEFITFLKDSNFENVLPVRYTHRKSKKYNLDAKNLYNAFEQYDWNGINFANTKVKLDDLKGKVREGYKNGNIENFKNACKDILKWGNVNNSVKKLEDTKFFECVKKLENSLKNNLDVNATLTEFKEQNSIFSNAGFTKIYSLLFDNWIIYDSRVAAGLQYLILKYLDSKGETKIPDTLNLASPPSRGDKSGNYRVIPHFKKISYSKYSNPDYRHLEANLIANYILTEYLKVKKDTKFKSEDPLRQLEAALFMIGYDLTSAVSELGFITKKSQS